jgi:hypothetical protein
MAANWLISTARSPTTCQVRGAQRGNYTGRSCADNNDV